MTNQDSSSLPARGSVELGRQPDIRSYQGQRPQIAVSAYIDPACVIIGDVIIGEDSSVWPLTVIRGDVNHIRIGARTNIQDASILHVMKDEYPLLLGDDITIGHGVTLHGCTIESRCLVGMRATILNGAVIGKGSIVAAGALVLERTIIPPRQPRRRQPRQSQTHPHRHRSGRHRPLRRTLRPVQKHLQTSRESTVMRALSVVVAQHAAYLSFRAKRGICFSFVLGSINPRPPHCHSERSRPTLCLPISLLRDGRLAQSKNRA